jgi:hypothetical protein|tara:strand:+ start:334 stop:534 length:201 start_codon:yes stop_codon:yes gene_type:complete
MNITQKDLEAKLKQIAEFEEKYGTDHGQTNVYAMKKYCTDAKYRERVQQFNNASINTIKHYERYGY